MDSPANQHERPDPNDPTRPRRGISDEDLLRRDSVFRPDLLAGKRILVTAGGSGMGKATAILAARLGATVAICGHNPDKLARVEALIAEATGRPVLARSVNIRDPDAVEAFIGESHAELGGLDTLVNNAGGQFPQGAIDLSRKGWLAVIDTDLNGSCWMMQEAAKRWRDAGAPGNIVAIVERGMPQAAHTCAARAGVIYLSKTLATEWAPLNIEGELRRTRRDRDRGVRHLPRGSARPPRASSTASSASSMAARRNGA